MQVLGEWFRSEDGVTRPVVRAHVLDVDGEAQSDRSLIDSGADRTAFSADRLQRLRLTQHRPSPGVALLGIGGSTALVFVQSAIKLSRDDGAFVTVHGEFAAFTDPSATNLSILGRDGLDNFDVILSRRRNEVLLLAPNHQCLVTRT